LGSLSTRWIARWLDDIHGRNMVRRASLGIDLGDRGLVDTGEIAGLPTFDNGSCCSTSGAYLSIRVEPSYARNSVERGTERGENVG